MGNKSLENLAKMKKKAGKEGEDSATLINSLP